MSTVVRGGPPRGATNVMVKVLQSMVVSESNPEQLASRPSNSFAMAQVGLILMGLGDVFAPLGIALVMAEISASSIRLWAILSIAWWMTSSVPLMILSTRCKSRVSSWQRGKSPAERVLGRLVFRGVSELAFLGLLLEVVMFRSRTHHLPISMEVIPVAYLGALWVLHPLAPDGSFSRD